MAPWTREEVPELAGITQPLLAVLISIVVPSLLLGWLAWRVLRAGADGRGTRGAMAWQDSSVPSTGFFIDAVPSAMFHCDPQWTVVQGNMAFERLVGVPPGESPGIRLEACVKCDANDADPWHEVSWSGEVQVRTIDGEVLPAILRTSSLLRHGRVVARLGSIEPLGR